MSITEYVSEEIDYKTQVSVHSDPVYRYLYPQNSGSVLLNASGTSGPVSILIPPACFNLAQSSLNFQIAIPSQGAGTYNYINANMSSTLSRVRLFDQATNAVWADINNFSQAMSILTPAATGLASFLAKSFCSSFSLPNDSNVPICPCTVATLSPQYSVEDLGRFNQQPVFTASVGTVATTLTVAVATYTPPQNIVGAFTTAATFVDMFTQNSYTSQRQFYISSTASVASYIDVCIPFSAFKFSVFNMDKLIYNPSNLELDLWFNSTDGFAFTSTDAANPQTGCASLTVAPSIQNISMTICNENNLRISQEVIQTVANQSIVLKIPYLTPTKNPIAASTSHAFQLALTSGYGDTLLGMITAPFQQANSGSLAYLANVHQRSYLNQYNTYINNISISNPSGYNALHCDDYNVSNRKFLKGSVIQTLGEYVLANWCHVDSWMGTRPLWQLAKECDKVTGLDLKATNSTWQLQATFAQSVAFNWLVILIGQKTLSLTSQGSLVY